MNVPRVLYQMARADFLERTRRYSFLVMLALVVWLGYASASGLLILQVPPNYAGVVNAAWVGALMTLTVTLFLGWFGFYLIRGSVSRDYDTGVGQIMATTPLSRPLYALGKWLSNFAILGVMILILVVAGVVMLLASGTADFHLWGLAAPMVLVALPCMGLVAAVAVLFEMVRWLRGGFGNLVYFIGFVMVMVPAMEMPVYGPLIDFTGMRLISQSVEGAAVRAYPECKGGFAFNMVLSSDAEAAGASVKRFPYEGISWTPGILLGRFLFLAVAIGLVMVGALFFDRFDPSALLRVRRKKRAGKTLETEAEETTPPVQAHLAPLPAGRLRLRPGGLFAAELKLLVKGQRWWWYAVAGGLIVASAVNTLEISRLLLAAAWFWPALLLSAMGNRHSRYGTTEILFSAPRPVLRQLSASWLAAVALLAVLGAGTLARLVLEGGEILPWVTGAMFIPSLALFSGVITKSNRTFEVVYVAWMYILIQKVRPLDFIGVAPGTPWPVFALLALALCVMAAVVRRHQVAVGV
jgi:hypothetical protein